MRKGITPIISIIILLLITIALAGVAYTFLMGQMFTRIGGSFDIPIGGAFCTNGQITILVTNTGTSDLRDEDFTIAQIDGTDVTASLEDVVINPEGSATLLSGYDCTSSCSSGYHTIDIGTKSLIKHENVHCP
jgi:flagellin-like protein